MFEELSFNDDGELELNDTMVEQERLVGEIVVIGRDGEEKLLNQENAYLVAYDPLYGHYNHCVVDADSDDSGIFRPQEELFKDMVDLDFVVINFGGEPDEETRQLLDSLDN